MQTNPVPSQRVSCSYVIFTKILFGRFLVDLEASEAAGQAVEAGLEALAAGLAAALRLVDASQRHLIQGHYPLAPTLQLAHPRVCEKPEKRVAVITST